MFGFLPAGVLAHAKKYLPNSLCIVILFFSSLAHSATFMGRAEVYLLDSLDFSETKVVSYGSLSNVNGTCSLGQSGALSGANGSNCSGEGQLGEFVISGSKDQIVSISVSPGESLSGITFTPSLHSGSTAVLTDGYTTALVGGDLNIQNAAQGSHNVSYIVSVNYN